MLEWVSSLSPQHGFECPSLNSSALTWIQVPHSFLILILFFWCFLILFFPTLALTSFPGSHLLPRPCCLQCAVFAWSLVPFYCYYFFKKHGLCTFIWNQYTSRSSSLWTCTNQPLMVVQTIHIFCTRKHQHPRQETSSSTLESVSLGLIPLFNFYLFCKVFTMDFLRDPWVRLS